MGGRAVDTDVPVHGGVECLLAAEGDTVLLDGLGGEEVQVLAVLPSLEVVEVHGGHGRWGGATWYCDLQLLPGLFKVNS